MDETSLDRRVVQCNYVKSTRIVKAGSRAYLVLTNAGGGNDRIIVLARSRSGRWIRKWENIKNLGNFRVKTLPIEHPMSLDERLWDYEPELWAERLNNAAP